MVLQTYAVKQIRHLNAEVTRGCNLSCDYCFNSSGKRMPNELGTEDWKRVLDISKQYGAKSSLFTGGEVMLRKDSPEIIAYSLERGLETSILTNGFRLKELGDGFIQDMQRVQISLDSASPYTHDSRRGNGSWKIARAAIDFARERGVPIEISTTISQDRLEELEGIVGVAYATGSKVLVRPLQQIGRANSIGDENLDSRIIEKQEKLVKVFGNIFVEDFANYVPVSGENHDNLFLPKGYVTVLPDGTIRGLSQRVLDLPLAA